MKTVIEMAKEAGLLTIGTADGSEAVYTWPKGITEEIERFAEIVRADEREKCALVAEDSDHVVAGRGYYDQLGDADATVRNIVAAIRARGTRAYDRYEGGNT